MSDPSHAASAVPRDRFATTRWSLVLQAAGDEPAAKGALAELCGRYWYPLYAFVRRQGCEPSEAEDLTQAFFVQLLEERLPAAADPQRGRFRSYLLGAFKHFIANHRRAERTQKRGGGRITSLSIDREQGERQYLVEPAHEETAERIF